jgi:L-erythro-3,5-diaminohexanoate dehydrogenase
VRLLSAVAPCRFGSDRVIEPPGTLPQAAWRIDNTPIARENELLCDVDILNIDSASFHQIAEAEAHDAGHIAAHILRTVAERGKQHNPATGSGGMFIGRVAAIGPRHPAYGTLHVGERIASLVSLSLTPLRLEEILRIDQATGRVWVRGQAILFESALYATLPADIPEGVALAVLDVAGAPAQTERLASPGASVVVIGADGKSGILSCAQAKARTGRTGRVIGVGPSRTTAGAQLLLKSGLVDAFIESDARDALGTSYAIAAELPGLADLTINCVNVPGTELASILSTKDRGTVYFFSMSTSFTAAALGAEGVGKDVTMIIGNGYAAGHAEIALQTLREHPPVFAYFEKRYRSA